MTSTPERNAYLALKALLSSKRRERMGPRQREVLRRVEREAPDIVYSIELHQCPVCGRRFRSRRGLSVHLGNAVDCKVELYMRLYELFLEHAGG